MEELKKLPLVSGGPQVRLERDGLKSRLCILEEDLSAALLRFRALSTV